MFKSIIMPLKIIGKMKSQFFIWVTLVLIISHIGIISSLFDVLIGESTLKLVIYKNFYTGNFYTIGIVFLASYVGSIIIDLMILYKRKETLMFFHEKLLLIGITFFTVIFGILGYSSTLKYSVNIIFDENFEILKSLIISEICFYIFSLLLSLYLFCISYLHLESDEKYNEQENENVKTLDEKSDEAKMAEGGAKL